MYILLKHLCTCIFILVQNCNKNNGKNKRIRIERYSMELLLTDLTEVVSIDCQLYSKRKFSGSVE